MKQLLFLGFLVVLLVSGCTAPEAEKPEEEAAGESPMETEEPEEDPGVRGIVLATSTEFEAVMKSPFNLNPQPGPGIVPMSFRRGVGDVKGFGSLRNCKTGKIAELD